MKMSVMFITFNRKKELLRAIQSCIKVRMDEMEIVIVDNHSEDGTQLEVEKLLRDSHMPYQYYYAPENLGISEGRNVAFSLCEGEYVFCLDDDAVIETEHFFNIVYEKMKANADAAAAAVEIFEPANNRFLKGYTYQKNSKKYALSYIGAAHVLKRETFEGQKLYPSSIRFGSEEYYVAYKIQALGMKMLYLDEVRVLHLPSIVARVYGDERKVNIMVNTYIIRSLCYPKLVLPILYVAFRNRLWRHHVMKKRPYAEIKQMIEARLDRAEVNRIPLRNFMSMLIQAGIKWVF